MTMVRRRRALLVALLGLSGTAWAGGPVVQDIALGQTPQDAAAFTGQAVTFAAPGETPWTGLVAAARPGDGTLLLQFTPPAQGNRLYSVAETVRFDAGGPRSAADALAPLKARFGEPAAVFDQTGKQVAVWRFVGGKPAAASVDVASDCSPYAAATVAGLRPIGWPGACGELVFATVELAADGVPTALRVTHADSDAAQALQPHRGEPYAHLAKSIR
ncbi:hypothetical protein FFK22_012705 [Mycobacterium sp. KBS0706]|uniref:hypothetical protein n=1 Tax=Mycobacterium sp. KBS0706 TaxID=2578109 RepID=UPI00117FDF08|nr:hypothetical protein [Mycobacterium sp. KBS0706]TSD88286.1 hypothetical protein FFK22_012705 [Mycobacterium sp. KBS0706]